jgi:hypothetical protein
MISVQCIIVWCMNISYKVIQKSGAESFNCPEFVPEGSVIIHADEQHAVCRFEYRFCYFS